MVQTVDRRPLDNQYINGIVIDIRNGVYRVGTKVGIKRLTFQRKNSISFKDRAKYLPKDKFVFIRNAVANLSNMSMVDTLLSVNVKQKRSNVKNVSVYDLNKKDVKYSKKCHRKITCN